jgi:hypothetical protein
MVFTMSYSYSSAEIFFSKQALPKSLFEARPGSLRFGDNRYYISIAIREKHITSYDEKMYNQAYESRIRRKSSRLFNLNNQWNSMSNTRRTKFHHVMQT